MSTDANNVQYLFVCLSELFLGEQREEACSAWHATPSYIFFFFPGWSVFWCKDQRYNGALENYMLQTVFMLG